MSFIFYLLSPVYPFHLSCNVYADAEREGVQKWWRGRLVMDSTNDLSLPLPPRSTMHLGGLKKISQGQQNHHNFHFPFSSGQKVTHGRDCTLEATFGYEQSFRLVENLISSTHWPDEAILFNTNIFIWVTILKGFFIHWKITFYDWHLVTLRIVLVSRMTWRVGKLTTHPPETRGIWVEIGRYEEVVWSRMTWN